MADRHHSIEHTGGIPTGATGDDLPNGEVIETFAGLGRARPQPGRVDVEPVIALGRLSLAFGRVDRATCHEDGTTPESDTDHTVMLTLVACAFAQRHLPDLDPGLVAQFASVHDVVEVYAGDTPTLRVDDAKRADKAAREEAALARIRAEFSETLPWLPDMIDRYERRDCPEARYVKAMDKLLPKITHILNGGATVHGQGLTRRELVDRYEQQLDELRGYAADFPPLFDLRAELVALTVGSAFAPTPATVTRP